MGIIEHNDMSCITYNLSSLNYVLATSVSNQPTNKVFSVNAQMNDNDEHQKKTLTVFADVERDQSFGQHYKYNKNCMLSVNTESNKKQLVHALYPVDQCYYKSAIYKVGKAVRTGTTYDFQNITNHKLDSCEQLSCMTQIDNTIYCLQAPSKYGKYDIDQDIYSFLSANNGIVSANASLISVAIYDKTAIQSALDENNIDKLQSIAVRRNVLSVQHNMIYEIPGQVYNDYDSGNIAATTYKCKNSLNSLYDMCHTTSSNLLYTRKYTNISHCGNQLFLTYNDCVSYGDEYKLSDELSNSQFGYNCDKVEIIDQINRFSTASGHNTNVYDIVIYTDLFNSMKQKKIQNNDDLTTKVCNTLQDELKHIVSDITKKLAPINTQLMNVHIVDI